MYLHNSLGLVTIAVLINNNGILIHANVDCLFRRFTLSQPAISLPLNSAK